MKVSPSNSRNFSRKMVLNILLIMFAIGAKKKNNLKFGMCCLFAEMHAYLSGVAFLSHIRIVTKETYKRKLRCVRCFMVFALAYTL